MLGASGCQGKRPYASAHTLQGREHLVAVELQGVLQVIPVGRLGHSDELTEVPVKHARGDVPVTQAALLRMNGLARHTEGPLHDVGGLADHDELRMLVTDPQADCEREAGTFRVFGDGQDGLPLLLDKVKHPGVEFGLWRVQGWHHDGSPVRG